MRESLGKLEDAHAGINIFDENYVNGKEAASKFADGYNTPEEAQAAQDAAIRQVEQKLGMNLGWRGSTVGEVDNLIKQVRSKELKEVLINSKFANEDTYQTKINQLVGDIESAEKLYKHYNSNLFSKNIDRNIAMTVMSNLVHRQAGMDYYKKKKANADKYYDELYNASEAVKEFDKTIKSMIAN
jgi:hypothetical protein